MSSDRHHTLGPSYNFDRMATSSEVRNKAIAMNVEVGVPMYKIHHSMVIADVALAIADQVEEQESVKLDRFVVEAGALLHDIGISQTEDDVSPEHAMIGADIVRAAGYPEEVARCVEMHDCGGLVEEVIQELGLAPTIGKTDTLPQSWEEKIAVYSDLMVSLEGEFVVDMWNDPVAPAKAIYPYLEIVYRHRRGLTFPTNHPQLYYCNSFNQEMIGYCPRSMYETLRLQINRMVNSMEAIGIAIPPLPVLSEWP